MIDFSLRWLFFLSLNGFARNLHNKDEEVYNTLMWGTVMVISLIALKLC